MLRDQAKEWKFPLIFIFYLMASLNLPRVTLCAVSAVQLLQFREKFQLGRPCSEEGDVSVLELQCCGEMIQESLR